MPGKKKNTSKHRITSDLILDLYKHTKTMTQPERDKTVEKIKKLVKYIGKEINIDLHDIKS